jgi:N-formylglutamate deformylase
LNGLMEPKLSPPFNLAMPDVQRAPLVLTSPHSGRCYPPAFLASSRLDAVAIRRSEDSFVDELFGAAAGGGVSARVLRRESRGVGAGPGDVS